MKTLKYSFTLLFVAFTLMATAQAKTIETKKSILSWTGKAAFNAYALTGTLNVKEGQISIKNDSITDLKITIDMKSLNHKNKDLKTHLRGKDFFEVNTYTSATFKITKPVVIKNNVAKIKGQMTIKNTTKTESFIIKFNENYSSLSFDISLDRTKYGVIFNSPNFFKKMKENAIADAFQLKGNLLLK